MMRFESISTIVWTIILLLSAYICSRQLMTPPNQTTSLYRYLLYCIDRCIQMILYTIHSLSNQYTPPTSYEIEESKRYDHGKLTKLYLDMIASRNWKDLLVWIVFHPDELLFVVDKRNQTVLHHACLFRAPAQIIQTLLYYKPELAHIPNNDHELPLHWAIRLSAPNEIIQLLLSVHPSSACCVKDKDGNTSLSMVWERHEIYFVNQFWQSGKQAVINDNRWARILLFFRCYSNYLKANINSDSKLCTDEGEKIRIDCMGKQDNEFLPLHTATQCPCCPLSLYTLLIRVYSDDIRTRDDAGRIPLSVACSNPKSNRSIGVITKVHLLLSEDAASAQEHDSIGRLPLFTALASSLSWEEGIDRLIVLHPSSLLLHDPVTHLPAYLLAAVTAKSRRRNALKQQQNTIPDNDMATDVLAQYCSLERAQLTTIFSFLRKDPAQLTVTIRVFDHFKGLC